MRPDTTVKTLETFECLECGRRVEGPTSRRCAECQGDLVNVGVERDL